MKMKSIVLSLYAIITISHATTYYVSPTGSDSNDGLTTNTPWRTGNKASLTIQPGDTALFRGGVYTNLDIRTTPGTEALPITFKSYPNEKPVIKVAAGDYSVSPNAIEINVSGWIVIDGFQVDGGCLGIAVISSSNNIVQNCDVSGCYGSGITAIYANAINNIIRNCRVYNTAVQNWPRTNNAWGGGISISRGANHCLVENCVVYFIHGEAILLANVTGGTIRNCICADAWSAGFYINGGNNLVENNIGYCTLANYDLNYSITHSSRTANTLAINTEGQYALYASTGVRGVRGNRIVNNLTVQFDQAFTIETYLYPTNYNLSDCLFANNTCVGTFASGTAWNLAADPTDWIGHNFHIINNLYLVYAPTTLEYVNPATNSVAPMDIGNNLYVFSANYIHPYLGWNGNSYLYLMSDNNITNWWEASGETNAGPLASSWILDTNQANNIIANVYRAADSMPRLWQTNGGSPPDINVDLLFTNLATCSNNIVALRQQLALPFRPINNSTNPVITMGRAFPSWTWVDDYGVTNTMASPIGTDLLGNTRVGTPTIGALNPIPPPLIPPVQGFRLLPP